MEGKYFKGIHVPQQGGSQGGYPYGNYVMETWRSNATRGEDTGAIMHKDTGAIRDSKLPD